MYESGASHAPESIGLGGLAHANWSHRLAETFDVITGGAGFIGSHLAAALLMSDCRVRVIDDFSSGSRDRLSKLVREHGDRLDIVEASVCDLEILEESFAGVRHIYHLAAIPSVEDSIANPLRTHQTNAGGSLNVLLAARAAGARKVILASSCAVYGNPEPGVQGAARGLDPLSPYATSKLAGEFYAANFDRIFDLPTLSLRYYNVFGPGQDPGSAYAAVVPRFVTHVLAGRNPVIYGDGEQTRDFIYVENVVLANRLAAASDARGTAIDIGCGAETSLNRFVEMLGEVLDCDVDPNHEAARSGEVRHSRADVGPARDAIGFSPEIDFLEGLRRTVEAFRSENGT